MDRFIDLRLGLIFFVSFFFGLNQLGFKVDDSLIYGRYIQNFIDGFGLTYNRGELFNGLTSPLFVYINLAVSQVVGDVILSLNLVSMFFHVLLCLLMYLLKPFGSKTFDFLFAIFVAVSPYFLRLYGMETSLYLFLIVLCIYLFQIEDYFLLGICSALLLLTRSEGIFLLAAMLVFHFLLARKFPKLKYFIIPVALIVTHYMFNFHYYGEFIPDSSSAKVLHGKSGYWSGGLTFIPYFYIIIDDFGLSFLMLPFAAYSIFKIHRTIDKLIVLYLALLALFYIVLKIPPYQWYFAPFVVSYLYFSFSGLLILFEKFTVGYIGVKYSNIVLGVLYLVFLVPAYKDYKSQNIHVYESAGVWLKDRYDHNTSIAMVEIGFVGFYSELYVIDILGLVNHKNAEFVAQREMVKWFDHYSADLILIHEPSWELERETSDEALRRGFTVDDSFNFPGLKLLVNQ
jgi:arabinofuranosyltransferase